MKQGGKTAVKEENNTENNEVKNDDSIMAELFDSSEVKNEGFSLN